MLHIRQLSKVYKMGKDANDVTALNNLDIEFGSTGLVMIVGKSGCGKTTLLNILGGIDKPTSGSVEIDGQVVDYSSNNALDLYRSDMVSFIFQDYNLLYDYNVLDNIKLGMQLQETDKEEVLKRAEKALESVGLAEMRDRKISSLSGGQQQRIAIARAIAKDSKFVLCDEPTGNLDSTNSEDIFQLLKNLSANRLFIVVTHDEKLANKYADRIIKLEDGKVVEDKLVGGAVKQDAETTSVNASNADNTKKDKKTKAKKHAKGLSFRNMMLMIKDNIRNSLLSNITMLVALLMTFTLVMSFISMSSYNSNIAYVNTLRTNNQYVLPLLKYVDKKVVVPSDDDDIDTDNNVALLSDLAEGEVSYGPQPYYEGAKAEDIATLKSQVSNANYYPSYFLNKNLQDFTDKTIFTDSKQFQYAAYGFREAIAVEDFSTFHMELLSGELPSQENEVLIYDYMAYSMIENGLLSGNISDVVGKTLTDIHTGFTMTISGLIRSDYARYEYVKEGSLDYSFEETYLAGLQVIYCYPTMITKLEAEHNYTPVMHADLVQRDDEGTTTSTTRLDTKKLKYIDISNLKFIATNENITGMRGIIMSRSQVAELLKIGVEEVTEQKAKEFMEQYSLSMLVSLYDYTSGRSYAFIDGYSVIGVCNEEVAEDGVLAISTHDQGDLKMNTGAFRQIYLSLGADWSENVEVIESFDIVYKTQEFYEANPDYYYEGYTTNSPYRVMITDADEYMYKVKDFSSYIMYILIALTVVFIVIYTYINLKKYDYKIGVLKALGANTWNIILVFGLQLLLISLVAYLLAVPCALLVMSRINFSFVGNSTASLVLFSLSSMSPIYTLLIATVGVSIIALIPLLRLAFASPISVIRGSRSDQ